MTPGQTKGQAGALLGRARVSVAVLIVVLLLIIVFQNTDSVQTKLLFISISMPKAILLFLTAGAGFAVGLAVSGRVRRR